MNRIPRIFLDMPFQRLSEDDLDGYQLHHRVVNHEVRLPCMTSQKDTGQDSQQRYQAKVAGSQQTMGSLALKP